MFDDKKPGKELDDTMASAANDRLEEILKRIKTAGGEITLDEKTPLYIDFNNESEKIGERRIIEFNLRRTNFQITRDIKNMRSGGGTGHRKHLEQSDRPMIETKLKRRPDTSDQWEAVDFEDLF